MTLRARLTRFATMSAIVCLTACAQPTTMAPQLSQADLDREAQLQHDMVVQQNHAQATAAIMGSRSDMESRLHRIAAPLEASTVKLCKQMSPGSSCYFNVILAKDGPLNAWADGKSVTVTPAMMEFAQGDDELSFIVAHEMGHNMMKHIDSQQQNQMGGGLLGTLVDGLFAAKGYDTGNTFSSMGSNAGAEAFSKDFEREADYTAMYLMADAGLPYQNSGNIWRRMTVREPDTAFLATSHPSNPERYVALENITREIDQKKATGQPLLPTMKKPSAS